MLPLPQRRYLYRYYYNIIYVARAIGGRGNRLSADYGVTFHGQRVHSTVYFSSRWESKSKEEKASRSNS